MQSGSGYSSHISHYNGTSSYGNNMSGYGSIQQDNNSTLLDEEDSDGIYWEKKKEFGCDDSQDGSDNILKQRICGWSLKEIAAILISLKVLVVGIIFIIGLYAYQQQNVSSTVEHSVIGIVPSGNEAKVGAVDIIGTISSITSSVEDCQECPELIVQGNCTDHRYPVLGGLDVVQYFSFTNESEIGSIGSEEYQSTYDSYVYYFVDETNKQIFESDPINYIPQFGGFCSWGISGEYCPKYFWTAECLGPAANWGIWTIYQSKLYFFYLETAKDLFLENPSYYSNYGQSRWSDWFGPYNGITMNTLCYFNTSSGFMDSHMTNRTLPDGAPTQEKAEESVNSVR